ncbi:MAG: GldG family protein [Oscillospiraceae bacterium]
MKKNIFNNRRFKYGSLASIITAVFVAAVILINVIVTVLLNMYPLNIDITGNNKFKLTKESIAYLEELDNKVTITVCADEQSFKSANELFKQAYEIINDYKRHNKNIKVEFVDTIKEPTFAQKYPQFTLTAGDIIVETELRAKKISSKDLFSYSQTQYGGVIYSSKAEQILTSAIMYATDEAPVTVSVLSGIDNVDVSGYKDLLQKNNYTVIEQNILTEEINSDANMLVLPAPSADLSAEQVKKIEDFLNNDNNFGKSLVFIASPDKPVGPMLKAFLAEWGIEIGDGALFETNSSNAIMDNFTMLNIIKDEEVIKNLKTTTLPFVTRYTCPVYTLFETEGNRMTSTIASSSDTNVFVPMNAGEDFDPSKQETKAFNTIVKGARVQYTGMETKSSNVIVFGSSELLSSVLLNNPSFNNADIISNITGQLVNKKVGITILPVSFENQMINITDGQVNTFNLIFVLIVPALILILGIIVWMRRRHL